MTGEFFLHGAENRVDRLVGYTAEAATAHAESMVAETGDSVAVFEKRKGGPSYGTLLAFVTTDDVETAHTTEVVPGFKVTEVSDAALAAASPEYAAARTTRRACRSCGAALGAHHRTGCEFVGEGYSTRVDASQAVQR